MSLVVSVGAGVNPAHEYGNLEITNAIDYLFRNVQFLRFMGDVVKKHCVHTFGAYYMLYCLCMSVSK